MADHCDRPWLRAWWGRIDRGISSETIAWILSGHLDVARETAQRLDAPYDTSDVGRCVRLLDLAASNGEDWRVRLPAVAEAVWAWRPLVPRWSEIEAAYRADVVAQTEGQRAAAKRWPATWRKRWKCPPSECWRLVSVLRGYGDPYVRRDA